MRLNKKSAALLLVVMGLMGLAIFANTLAQNNKRASGTIPVKKVVPGITNIESPKPPGANTSTSNELPTSDKTQSTVVASTDQSQEVKKPFGTFVSNHHPQLSGDNAQLTIQSVCSSTPGARCTVIFTKGEIIKSLPEQVVGSDGSTLWEWNIKGAGITAGTWSIKAIAKIGEKSAETVDALNLEVAP